MLPRSSPQFRRRALLESYIAPEVVAHILSDGRAPLLSGVRIPVTVLFADVRNFTRFAAALPAKRVVAFLDDYFEAMAGPATARGGTIDKLMGDAVMVVFGAPRASGDEAARAILAATAMHKAFVGLLGRWQVYLPTSLRLGLGIGCASGQAVLANVGSSARMDYTVIGEPVNLAARLTSIADDGVTLVSGAVRDAARTVAGFSLQFSRGRRLSIKGIRGRVTAYPAVALADGDAAPVTPTTTDPVCGMKLPAGGPLRAAHGSRTYYFCSVACRGAFRRNPRRFVAQRSARRQSR